MQLIFSIAVFGITLASAISDEHVCEYGPSDCFRHGYMPLVSLQSVNYPDRYVRHCSWHFWIDNNAIIPTPTCNRAIFHQDATFYMRSPGMSGAPGTVSFQSLNYPGYYLRHRDFLMELEAYDHNAPKDFSFLRIPGKSNALYGSTFQVTNDGITNFYIRHCSNRLIIHDGNGRGIANGCDPNPQVFLNDVTFRVTPGLALSP